MLFPDSRRWSVQVYPELFLAKDIPSFSTLPVSHQVTDLVNLGDQRKKITIILKFSSESGTYHGIHKREGSKIKEGPPSFTPHWFIHMVQLINNVIPQIAIRCRDTRIGMNDKGYIWTLGEILRSTWKTATLRSSDMHSVSKQLQGLQDITASPAGVYDRRVLSWFFFK